MLQNGWISAQWDCMPVVSMTTRNRLEYHPSSYLKDLILTGKSGDEFDLLDIFFRQVFRQIEKKLFKRGSHHSDGFIVTNR